MSFWTDDIDNMFFDFSVDVEIGTNTVKGILDEAQEIVDMQTGQVVGANPVVIIKTTDLTGVNVRDEIIINDVTYYINSMADDGTGITSLVISEN